MFRSLRITLLSMIIGLLLFGPITCPILSAQGNDFPIDLYMLYNICVYPDNPTEPGYSYDITYSFTSWVDEENYVIEFERNYNGIVNTYVAPLSDVHVALPGSPPIWRNVTTWEINDMIYLSGLNYEICNKIRSTGTGGYSESFLLWNVTQSANLTYKTALRYHSPLGILVDYWREKNSTNGDPNYGCLDLYVWDTNLYEYFPLINDSQTTTTTSTTQPPGTSETTSVTTGPNTNPALPLVHIDVNFLLIVGVIIELLVVVLLIARRLTNAK